MKVISVSHSDMLGGANIAAYRAHQALLSCGLNAELWVDKKTTSDNTVIARRGTSELLRKPRAVLGSRLIADLQRSQNPEKRSLNMLPSMWLKALNKREHDLTHLHWCHNEMLSIRDVTRIRGPVVQTLNDMWTFCGSEHYATDERWINGYTTENRAAADQGPDLDRWTWNRKKAIWQKPWHLIAVSQWMADCVANSHLLQRWPFSIIPNTLDISIWKPLDRKTAREALNLPLKAKIITFGAVRGTANTRKGYSYLLEALKELSRTSSDIHLVIYGQSQPEIMPDLPFPVSFMGKINDPVLMNLLNNASDVFVNSALQEAFGQTASEAQASGLPAVGFTSTGMDDVVAHKVTGYLAAHGSHLDLANGIAYVLDNTEAIESPLQRPTMRSKAQERAHRLFSYSTVGAQHIDLYQQLLHQS